MISLDNAGYLEFALTVITIGLTFFESLTGQEWGGSEKSSIGFMPSGVLFPSLNHRASLWESSSAHIQHIFCFFIKVPPSGSCFLYFQKKNICKFAKKNRVEVRMGQLIFVQYHHLIYFGISYGWFDLWY